MRRGRIRARRQLGNREHAGIATPTSKWEERHENRHRRSGTGRRHRGLFHDDAPCRFGDPARRSQCGSGGRAGAIFGRYAFCRSVRVRAGEFADLDGARLVVLAAGTNQRPGESRLDLLSRNAEIFAEIVPAVLAAAPDPIFLVATNPVDVMTQIVTAIAGRGGIVPERVIGSGTILDSARFRTLLAVHLGISPTYIDARVLGEHGDSEVLHRSGAAAGNLSVAEVARQMERRLTEAERGGV
jgi:hypothetical protein